MLSRLYVRKKNLPSIDPKHRPEFRTKLELGVELLRWANIWLGRLGKPIWLVADGAYAKANFLKPAQAMEITVVSRLRKDAALWTEPKPRRAGRRGRPRIYGEAKIDLAKLSRPATRLEHRGPSSYMASGRSSGTRRFWRPGDLPVG